MKKGISLIVLVITIIVMIIIAGAIIISLNSTNVIEKANTAVDASNEAELKSLVALTYMNQYVAYWEAQEAGTTTAGDTSARPTADSVEKDTAVAVMLAEMNKNNTGVVYSIEDHAAGGVYVMKTDGSTTSQI